MYSSCAETGNPGPGHPLQEGQRGGRQPSPVSQLIQKAHPGAAQGRGGAAGPWPWAGWKGTPEPMGRVGVHENHQAYKFLTRGSLGINCLYMSLGLVPPGQAPPLLCCPDFEAYNVWVEQIDTAIPKRQNKR